MTEQGEVERLRAELSESRGRECTALCNDLEEDRDRLSEELDRACAELELLRPVPISPPVHRPVEVCRCGKRWPCPDAPKQTGGSTKDVPPSAGETKGEQ